MKLKGNWAEQKNKQQKRIRTWRRGEESEGGRGRGGGGRWYWWWLWWRAWCSLPLLALSTTRVSKSNQSRCAKVLSRPYDAPQPLTLLGTPHYPAHHFKGLLSKERQCWDVRAGSDLSNSGLTTSLLQCLSFPMVFTSVLVPVLSLKHLHESMFRASCVYLCYTWGKGTRSRGSRSGWY